MILLAAGAAAEEFQPEAPREAQMDESVAPIVIRPDARTYADVEREQTRWVRRVLVDPAMKRLAEKTDVALAADAGAFLGMAAPALFPERWGTFPEELAKEGRRLVAAGCDDPAVCLIAAMLDLRSGKDWRIIRDAAAKTAAFVKSAPETPAAISYHAHVLLAWANQEAGFPSQQKAAAERVAVDFQRMAADGSYGSEETELLVRHFLIANFLPDPFYREIKGGLEKAPLPEWASAVIAGMIDNRLTAGAEGSERIKLEASARASLEKSWRLNPKSPIAASEMMAFTGWGEGRRKGETRIWFDRAIAAQCDFEVAYRAMLSYQWSISSEALLNFGKACFETKRYDLDIPVQFTRACNYVAGEDEGWRKLYQRPDIAGPLVELSEGFVNEPSREGERPLRLSYLVVNSWLVGDHLRATAALEALGGPLHPNVQMKLRIHRISEQTMREEIALGNSKEANGMKVSETLLRVGELDQAEAVLRKLEGSVEAESQRGIRERILCIGIERQLQAGGWVALSVTPDLIGWEASDGKWSATEDGILINHGDDKYGALVHRAQIGPDFEMRFSFSVEAKSNCCQRCGAVFARADRIYGADLYATYGRWGTAKPTAVIQEKVDYKPQSKDGPALMETNEVHLICRNGTLTFLANGKPQFADLAMANKSPGDPNVRVGISNTKWCKLNTTRISKIEVRRIPGDGH